MNRGPLTWIGHRVIRNTTSPAVLLRILMDNTPIAMVVVIDRLKARVLGRALLTTITIRGTMLLISSNFNSTTLSGLNVTRRNLIRLYLRFIFQINVSMCTRVFPSYQLTDLKVSRYQMVIGMGECLAILSKSFPSHCFHTSIYRVNYSFWLLSSSLSNSHLTFILTLFHSTAFHTSSRSTLE